MPRTSQKEDSGITSIKSHKFNRLLSILVPLFSMPIVASADLGAREADCKIAKMAIEEASKIRGLGIRKVVPCVVQTKEEVKGYLLGTLVSKLPKRKLANEALVYSTIGMIPKSFNYETGLVDLYVSQIGGYYDPDRKRFVMAGWMPALFQTTVAIHEQTHALQDQYFNLETFVDPKLENGDILLARSALVEGDATAVMIDYNRKLAGQASIAQEKDVHTVLKL